MEEKIWANYLLDGIRKDVIKKLQGQEVTEQVYSAVIQLLRLAKVAYKDGLLALEKEMEDGMLESGLNDITIFPMGIEYIVDGMESEILAEILTTKYWVKNPQGMEALAYFILIHGMLMIQECTPVYYLEMRLLALLPENSLVEYERRKEDRNPEQTLKTKMEILLEQETSLPKRSIIIRNALEEKINQATESALKGSMKKLDDEDDGWSAFVLRGLGRKGKQKLLSCMSSVRKNAVLETEVYMGPVRTIDIEDFMVKFLECIEETENKNAQL